MTPCPVHVVKLDHFRCLMVMWIFQATEHDLFLDPTDKAITGFGYALEGSGYGEQDNGQITWFNAGVRVGVGIGLGMCLGVGIGVGLMVRTYQATTRTFRRGFF